MHSSQIAAVRSPTSRRSALPDSPQKLHVKGLAAFAEPLRLSAMYMR
jgi:hypothetical protein